LTFSLLFGAYRISIYSLLFLSSLSIPNPEYDQSAFRPRLPVYTVIENAIFKTKQKLPKLQLHKTKDLQLQIQLHKNLYRK